MADLTIRQEAGGWTVLELQWVPEGMEVGEAAMERSISQAVGLGLGSIREAVGEKVYQELKKLEGEVGPCRPLVELSFTRQEAGGPAARQPLVPVTKNKVEVRAHEEEVTKVDVKRKEKVKPVKRKGRAPSGCGVCPACTAEDCGACRHCLDKPSRGGKGRLRQKCVKRKCTVGKGGK